MKKIYYLKNVMNIIIYASLLIIGIMVAATIYSLIIQDFTKLKITFNGEVINHLTNSIMIVMIFVSIGYVFFMYSIIKLNQLISLFVKRKFFTNEACKKLKQIGISFFISSLFTFLPIYFYSVFENSELKINFQTIQPNSLSFSIIISLFFIILSYIFTEAQKIKEENELTI